ncbi:hypothetical protein LY78DRAFT_650898 [Colletotrichum sublineola]|nr:hypothetical protein LY78DRAFT_650898 [Colletotrichum sublineola]
MGKSLGFGRRPSAVVHMFRNATRANFGSMRWAVGVVPVLSRQLFVSKHGRRVCCVRLFVRYPHAEEHTKGDTSSVDLVPLPSRESRCCESSCSRYDQCDLHGQRDVVSVAGGVLRHGTLRPHSFRSVVAVVLFDGCHRDKRDTKQSRMSR